MLLIDILSAVNDKSTSWVQHVKLLRYAWVSESVILLNKKQTLMNILVSAVSFAHRYYLSCHNWFACSFVLEWVFGLVETNLHLSNFSLGIHYLTVILLVPHT